MVEHKKLREQLVALEDIQGDTVPASDVRAFVSLVRDLLSGEGFQEGKKDINPAVYGKLGEFAKIINSIRNELAELNASMSKPGEKIPDASQQLGEIIQTTEKATHKIMDACEQVQGINTRIRDRLMVVDPPLDEDVMMSIDDAIAEADTHVANVLEACNFQDLTGQRLQKVIKALQDIERQVMHMVIMFGLEGKGDKLKEEDKKALASEAELLQGPDLGGQGLDQDDIDDILAKLL